ncbi:DMT family transporter [Devosia ginsengisoli]|uniref:DMT family transporter n=1 Tax=Devosia ginsengisoli TaxID=400770 RepID=UPI0026EB3C3D|nr:DMT family transporter [Devosia ginsengisoli]MCR6671294.1 DMT family transporter [Devosia ginsengisoli]
MDDKARTRAVVAAIAAAVMFAFMDTIAKELARSIATIQVAWARYAFHAIAVLAVLLYKRQSILLTRERIGLQLLQSLCLLASTIAMYQALQQIPLAMATTLQFASPFFVVLISVVLLREEQSWLKLGVTVTGVIGVAIMVRPSGDLQAATVLPVLSALFMAAYYVVTKKLSAHNGRSATLFLMAAIPTVMLTLFAPFWWHVPTLREVGLMMTLGVMGAVGHGLILYSFQYAESSSLAPYLYIQVLVSGLIGLVYLHEPITTQFLLGGGVILTSSAILRISQRSMATTVR